MLHRWYQGIWSLITLVSFFGWVFFVGFTLNFFVSVHISFEGVRLGMGWLRSQVWRWAGSMSSQSRGSWISESDNSDSEYSSVEEMYGSGNWVCCRVSVEHGCSVGRGDWESGSACFESSWFLDGWAWKDLGLLIFLSLSICRRDHNHLHRMMKTHP